MAAFVTGADRMQGTMFPAQLDICSLGTTQYG